MISRILYLTWGETPRTHGVYKTQVCNLLSQLAKLGLQPHLLSAVPYINSSLVRECDFKGQLWRDVQAEYPEFPSSILYTLSPQPLQRVSQGMLAFKAPFWGAIAPLVREIEKIQPQVIHCRSYHATYAAISARKRSKVKPKIIFDMRGFFPEELLKLKGHKTFTPAYESLKIIENKLLNESDAIAVLNQEMSDVINTVPDAKKHILYPPVKLATATAPTQAPMTPPHYLYVGAIGDQIWHTQTNLMRQFKSILAREPDAVLIMATRSNPKEYQQVIDAFGADKVRVISYSSEQERAAIFSKASFGLLPYTDLNDGPAAKIGQTLLGTKTVEYLCEGIPVIVHPDCRAAARIVRENNLGIICNNDLSLPVSADLQDFRSVAKRDEIKQIAQGFFGIENVSQKYADLYSQLG